MSIATRINAIEEHIGNAYDKLDDLGIDLTNIDKNIDNIAEMLDTVYQDYPKVTGTGTEVTLNGTKAGKLGLDIKGNSTQDGTPSPTNEVPIYSAGDDINLFDKNNANTIDCLINNTTKVFGGFSGAKTLYIPITGGKTYTVSKIVSARFAVGSSVSIPAANVVCSNTSQDNSASSITLQTESTDNYLAVFYYLSSADTLTEQQILNSIKITTGVGSISEKIVNKNLFDTNNLTNGYLTSSGNITTTNQYRVSDYIDVSSSLYVTISGSAGASEYNCFYDVNKNFVNKDNMGTDTTKTITVPSNAMYIRCTVKKENIDTYQVELGSTATTYTAHQEQTYTIPVQQPMRSIGTIRDEFPEGENVESHNLGRVVLNGEETWTFSSTANAWYIAGWVSANNSKAIANNDVLANVLSNYFIVVTRNNLPSATNGIAISSSGALNIKHQDYTSSSDINSFKAWLSTNKPEVIYELATPQDLPCTSEQIAILENLPKSYNEQTNIYSLDVTPAYIEAEALKGE